MFVIIGMMATTVPGFCLFYFWLGWSFWVSLLCGFLAGQAVLQGIEIFGGMGLGLGEFLKRWGK